MSNSNLNYRQEPLNPNAGAITGHSLSFVCFVSPSPCTDARPCDYAIETNRRRDTFSVPLFFALFYYDSLTAIFGVDGLRDKIETAFGIVSIEVGE